MGHGQSKGSVGRIGTGDAGIMVHCRLEECMTTTLVIPEFIAEQYSLKFESCVGLKDTGDGVYCCYVEEIDGKLGLTKGWAEFLCSVGAVVGDCMVFDIKGADETVVWLFKGCSATNEETKGESSMGAVIVGHSQMVNHPTSTADSSVSVTLGEDDTDGSPGDEERRREVLAEWRAHMVVGKNVELEDWMVEYVACGQNWKLPEVKMYIGRVEGTAMTNNRLRLPRSYTAEHVLPLLKTKNEVVYLQGRYEQARIVKFCIGKDGRATFTLGWTDFAVANGVGGGSIVAYIFGKVDGEVDVEIDVIHKEG